LLMDKLRMLYGAGNWKSPMSRFRSAWLALDERVGLGG
jgi:hypothetical protein